MSETTLLVGNFMGMKVKPGSMGKPGPGYKVDIIDDLGKNKVLKDKTEIQKKLYPSSKILQQPFMNLRKHS